MTRATMFAEARELTNLQVATGVTNEAAWLASLIRMTPGQLENEWSRLHRLWQYHEGFPGHSGKVASEARRLMVLIRATQARRLALQDDGPDLTTIHARINHEHRLAVSAQPHRKDMAA